MPSAAQGRGFLRNYCDFLELDLDAELADIQKNPPEPSEISGPLPNADIIPEQPESAEETSSRPSWLNRLRSVQDRLLPRRPNPNGESAPEVESPGLPSADTDLQVQAEKVEPPKRRGRKKGEGKTSDKPARKGRKKSTEESTSNPGESLPEEVGEIRLENEYLLVDGEHTEDEALNRPVTEGNIESDSKVQNETESPPVVVQQVEESVL
jgi:hypothetical protein